MLCLASPSHPYESDVSNGILLKMLSLTNPLQGLREAARK